MNKKDTKLEMLLTRGVFNILPDAKELIKDLKNNKLRVKFGIDPTGPLLHIGRAIPLWKLKYLQDFGHQIVLIIGDFTAQIGDTSDKEAERQILSFEEVKKNMETYLKQIGTILDINKTEIHYNSSWLSKLSFKELCSFADDFSVAEFLARDNFSKRYKSGKRISLRELMYPLMQGYDSKMVECDLEVGGSDQLFNILAGRTIQKYYKQKPQYVMTFELLEGTDGRKMSTSYGNIVAILDDPKDKYGKIMSIKDDLIVRYYELCTQCDVSGVKNRLEMGDNPRDLKMSLAYEIVKLYDGPQEASKAQKYFVEKFQKKVQPKDIDVYIIKNKINLLELLSKGLKFTNSKSEARRKVQEGAVKIDGRTIKDIGFMFELAEEETKILKLGRKMVRITSR